MNSDLVYCLKFSLYRTFRLGMLLTLTGLIGTTLLYVMLNQSGNFLSAVYMGTFSWLFFVATQTITWTLFWVTKGDYALLPKIIMSALAGVLLIKASVIDAFFSIQLGGGEAVFASTCVVLLYWGLEYFARPPRAKYVTIRYHQAMKLHFTPANADRFYIEVRSYGKKHDPSFLTPHGHQLTFLEAMYSLGCSWRVDKNGTTHWIQDGETIISHY